MRLRLAFISFIVVGVCSSVLLVVLQCSSTQTIIRDKASSAELKHVQYGGGNGDSYETAVVLSDVRGQHVVMPAEYEFISQQYGPQDKKWKVIEQTQTSEGKKIYDMVQFEVLATGEKKIIYFEVTKLKKHKSADEP
jgi:hypothetical protein